MAKNPATTKPVLSDISVKFTEDILVECLRTYSGKSCIKDVSYEIVGGGTIRGDSYLSEVYRIKLEGFSQPDHKKHSLALIVKCLPVNIGRRKTFKSTNFFENEAAFYNEVIPCFTSFQEKRTLKQPFIEIPRCYKALADGENDFILMEDLSHLGYEAVSRQQGFDLEHCSKVLQILGKFHALSFAMKDQDPDEFQKARDGLQETYYKTENKSWYEDQMRRLNDVAIDAVSKELPNTIYEEKLKDLTDSGFYDRMVELVKPKEPYAVISHGDCWCPNFLFQYSDGKSKSQVQDLRLIDFQLARYCSPALDLSFMIYSCTTKELRDSYFDDLIQVYYKNLSQFLSELGSSPNEIFPYKSLQSEMASYFIFGFGMSLESVPFSLMDDDEAPDLDKIVGTEAVPLTDIWIVNPIKTAQGRLRIADNVRHAVDNGFL